MNRKAIILAVLACTMPLGMMAQEDDDMYFISSKSKSKSVENYGIPKDTYYSGSSRSIDDYNRRYRRYGSVVQPIDSLGNATGDTVDNADDYACTRQMSRWDDYAWTDPYWAGYYAGRSAAWGFYDPWYDPWYTGFYDPWYYGGWYGYRGWYSPWYAGWYSPWYSGWYGYYGGWAGNWGYVPVGRYTYAGHTGSANHMTGTGRQPLNGGTFGRGTAFGGGNGSFGSQSFSAGVANRDRRGSFRGTSGTFNAQQRFGGSRGTQSTQTYQQRDNTFNQSRSNGSSFSGGSFGGSLGSGSFGGSRGGGSFGGGGSRGGGGGFGGRR